MSALSTPHGAAHAAETALVRKTQTWYTRNCVSHAASILLDARQSERSANGLCRCWPTSWAYIIFRDTGNGFCPYVLLAFLHADMLRGLPLSSLLTQLLPIGPLLSFAAFDGRDGAYFAGLCHRRLASLCC